MEAGCFWMCLSAADGLGLCLQSSERSRQVVGEADLSGPRRPSLDDLVPGHASHCSVVAVDSKWKFLRELMLHNEAHIHDYVVLKGDKAMKRVIRSRGDAQCKEHAGFVMKMAIMSLWIMTPPGAAIG